MSFRVPATALATLLLTSCGAAAIDSPRAQASGSLVAHLYAPTHHPKVNHAWKIRITARDQSGNPVKADVRIISATNANLEERVAARQFREDV